MLSQIPHQRLSRFALVIAMALVSALMVCGGAPKRAAAQTDATRIAAMPAALPAHFSFGIMDGHGGTSYLDTMRAQNGTAWDYRYNYLSAGVNTGHGWATWNSPAGQYATYFMQDNQSNHYMTAFVYYMMLQSNGPGGNGEAGTDLAHMDSPALMQAYYADWALLMQKIGADGAPVLVIVEPDLWGYIEQAAVRNGSNSAASIPASVASSGYADAQGLPNTAQGFAWALLRIRDHYAHNAILALHASTWGTTQDIASNTSAALNVTALGTQEGQFLLTAGTVGNPAGISSFDIISSDISDHDAGQNGSWWDKNNVTFPNFARYLQFIHALGAAANRRIMMWQVPVGNQYFDSENNSPGHTQDNKAAYIIGHIPDFANVGIIGVLFGPGNGGTNVFDNQGDGVTNPAPITTYECNACNTQRSVYADDDGGYLRLTLGQYYQKGPYPLSGGAFTPPLPPQTPTSIPTATVVPTLAPTATLAATATSGSVAVVGNGSTTTNTNHATSSSVSWWPIAIALLAMLMAGSGGYIWWWRRRQASIGSGNIIVSDSFDIAPDHWGFGATGQPYAPDLQENWAPADSADAPIRDTTPWQAADTTPLPRRQPRGWE